MLSHRFSEISANDDTRRILARGHEDTQPGGTIHRFSVFCTCNWPMGEKNQRQDVQFCPLIIDHLTNQLPEYSGDIISANKTLSTSVSDLSQGGLHEEDSFIDPQSCCRHYSVPPTSFIRSCFIFRYRFERCNPSRRAASVMLSLT